MTAIIVTILVAFLGLTPWALLTPVGVGILVWLKYRFSEPEDRDLL